MGVRRLSGLLESHREIYRDELFGTARLVVDGCDLIKHLYFDSGLDQNHGGEYAAFEELIAKFITALTTCGVSPYVVLRGDTDVMDKKLQTLTDRAEDRIWRAQRAAEEGTQENILPPLVNLVFKQTLEQLKVPMATCMVEASQEIAALANEWECPVLSCDSDFYIFDVPAGLLPLPHFQWRGVKQKDSQSFIPCKSYSISNFCVFFGIQKQLLPTFATLAGNDYVKLRLPIRWAQFCQGSEEKWSRLRGLLCWLKGFQLPEEAVEAALELIQGLNKEKKQKVRNTLYLGMQEYLLPHSCLKNFFSDGTLPPFPEAQALVPDWIQPLLVQGKITTDILDVLRLQQRVLSICVGSTDLPSAYLTSTPLRQVMYGLLLPAWGSNMPLKVTETDRVGLKLGDIPITPIFTITSKHLQLNSLHKVEPCHRLPVLLKALGVSEAILSSLLPQLRLPLAVTCYWWRNAHPHPGDRLLRALLLGLSIGASQSQEPAQQIKSIECDSSNSEKSDVGVAHNITQWQICLKDSIHLNQLLGLPLPEPQVSRLYEGALVHHLVQRMTSGKLKNYLEQDIPVVEEYKKMLAIVRQFDCRQPRRNRVGRHRHPQTNMAVDPLYDPEEEAAAVRALRDLDLEHGVPHRPRYKRQVLQKKKYSWPSYPVFVLKDDCREDGDFVL